MATSPPSTVTIAMTMATMGRRMKKAAMSVLRLLPPVRRWCGFTTVPAATVVASTITRAPASSPFCTIQRLPTRPPTVTVCTVTLLSCPTVRTCDLPWSSVTARCGTSSALVMTAVRAVTRPYWPGRSRWFGFGNAALMRIVPVRGSISRSAARNVPFSG